MLNLRLFNSCNVCWALVWSVQSSGWAANCSKCWILAVKSGRSKIVLGFPQALWQGVYFPFNVLQFQHRFWTGDELKSLLISTLEQCLRQLSSWQLVSRWCLLFGKCEISSFRISKGSTIFGCFVSPEINRRAYSDWWYPKMEVLFCWWVSALRCQGDPSNSPLAQMCKTSVSRVECDRSYYS